MVAAPAIANRAGNYIFENAGVHMNAEANECPMSKSERPRSAARLARILCSRKIVLDGVRCGAFVDRLGVCVRRANEKILAEATAEWSAIQRCRWSLSYRK